MCLELDTKMMDYQKQAHHQQHLHRLLAAEQEAVVIACQSFTDAADAVDAESNFHSRSVESHHRLSEDDESHVTSSRTGDAPIDLSQLSTRRPTQRKKASLEEMVNQLKCTSQRRDSNKSSRSVTPVVTEETLDLLRYRCMSDSRLNPASGAHDIASAGRDQEMCDADEPSHLRRTVSETIVPSRIRSPDMTAAALELMKRQQQLLQEHYNQVMQSGSLPSPGGVANSTDPAYLSAAFQSSPWLYLGLFGYSHMLQSFQAQEYLRQMAATQSTNPSSGHVSAGHNTPVPSPSGSDETSDPQGSTGGFNGHQKRRSPRALTGKHVRLGTGASPTTLQTLRMKIEERQKMKLRGPAAWPQGGATSARKANAKKSSAKSRKKKD